MANRTASTARKRASRRNGRRAGTGHLASSRWRIRIGWGVAIAGLIAFLVGNVGARAGLELFSFDPHHVVLQWGGAAVGIAGLLVATARRR